MLIKTKLIKDERIHADDDLVSIVKHPISRVLDLRYADREMFNKVWRIYWATLRRSDSVAGRENICL